MNVYVTIAAVEAIEKLTGKKESDWDYDNSTFYEGDNNYETFVKIVESEVYEK